MRLVVFILLSGLFVAAHGVENEVFQLAFEGNVEALRRIVKEHPASVNLDEAEEEHQYTVLHYACAGGHLPTVKFLVENGAGINPPSSTGDHWRRHPIAQAVLYGHQAVVEYLLAQGAERVKFDIELPIENGHVDLVRFLVENRLASENPSALVRACEGNRIDLVKFLLESHWKTDDHSLKMVFTVGAHECVKLMVTRQNVNLRDPQGQTPLHWSAQAGSVESTRWVIEHGGDVNAVSRKADAWGAATPLHEAARYGHVEVVKLLLQEGADVNARMITYGGLPFPRYRKSNTPLLVAIFFDRKEVARTLIQMGADLSILNTKRKLRNKGWQDLLGE